MFQGLFHCFGGLSLSPALEWDGGNSARAQGSVDPADSQGSGSQNRPEGGDDDETIRLISPESPRRRDRFDQSQPMAGRLGPCVEETGEYRAAASPPPQVLVVRE